MTVPEAILSFEAAGIQVMNPARTTAMILSNLVRGPTLFHLLSQVAATEAEGPDVTEVTVGLNGAVGRTLPELKLPAGVLILLIRRSQRLLIPQGDTRFEPGDIVSLVGTPRSTAQAVQILQGT